MAQLQYFDQIQKVMVESGQLVMGYFKSDFEIFEKAGGSIVTSVDLKNEQFLKSELIKIVPQAGFLAEESGHQSSPSDFMWVIDALDGTRNFVKGIPHFCIMVALTYKNDPVLSALYVPITQQLYYAEKNKGLWLQGVQQIKFVDRLKLTQTGVVVCGYDDWMTMKVQAKKHGLQVSRRYFGSIGLDALYLIQGNIDAIILRDVNWWDVAPGMLCITEAGGLSYTYEQSFVHEYQGTFSAGNELFLEAFDKKHTQNL